MWKWRLLLLILGPLSAYAQITPSDARTHVGQTQTVCGAVRTTRYAFTQKGSPTLINLGPTGDELVIIIWGKDLKNFRHPDFDYADANLCVTGRITNRHGTRVIEVKTPAQIVVHRGPPALAEAE